MNKWIVWDKYNKILILFGLLSLCWVRRSGKVFIVQRTCGFCFSVRPIVHMRGYYIQLGYYGGDIMWKSKICYEIREEKK